jgi:hypothetical protein
MFTHSKNKVIKRGKIKCPPQGMCGDNVKRLLDGTFHNINEFDVKMNLFSLINLINITLIKIM